MAYRPMARFQSSSQEYRPGEVGGCGMNEVSSCCTWTLTVDSQGELELTINTDYGDFRRVVRCVAWLAEFVSIMDAGAHCRLRLGEDPSDELAETTLLEVGDLVGSRWLAWPPATSEIPPYSKPADRVSEALRAINKRRAAIGMKDLDPASAGYTDDDIFADARAIGWRG
jgi:hypothetical protein